MAFPIKMRRYHSFVGKFVLIISLTATCYAQETLVKNGLQISYGFLDKPDSVKNELEFHLSIFNTEESSAYVKDKFLIKIISLNSDSIIRTDTFFFRKYPAAICGNGRTRMKHKKPKTEPEGSRILEIYQSLSGTLIINAKRKRTGKQIDLLPGEYKLTFKFVSKKPRMIVSQSVHFDVYEN